MKLPFINLVAFIVALLLGQDITAHFFLPFKSFTLLDNTEFFTRYCAFYIYLFGFFAGSLSCRKIHEIKGVNLFAFFLLVYIGALIGFLFSSGWLLLLFEWMLGFCLAYCCITQLLIFWKDKRKFFSFVGAVICGAILVYIFIQGFDFLSGVIIRILFTVALLLLYKTDPVFFIFPRINGKMAGFVFLGMGFGFFVGIYISFLVGILWGLLLLFSIIMYAFLYGRNINKAEKS